MSRGAPRRSAVLGMPVDVVSYTEATDVVLERAKRGAPGYVCVANVHMVMEAHDDAGFHRVVSDAALVVPDGMPLVWSLRAAGHPDATRVRGPTLVYHLAERAAREAVSIALYGGSSEALVAFEGALKERYPTLSVACAISPPYRALTEEERARDVERLVASGAGIVLVGLGCPKQERWMAAHYRDLPAVLVGVGAAFDINSGRVRESPTWMQDAGLEWLFRLWQEPRRLWRRYAVHNTRFVGYWILEALRRRVGRRRDGP